MEQCAVQFDEGAVFELRTGVQAARHVDGVTVRNSTTGAYFSLDGTAVFIWDLLCRASPLSAVKQAAAERYGMPRQEITAAIDAFVSELVVEGLLTPKSAEAREGEAT